MACLRQFLSHEGITALYRSYPVTVLMNIPFATTVVCVNENLKTWLQPWDRRHPHLWYFGCAGFAGALAAVITNPLDVIKTRL
jgi:solute carrier family 25 iron transporter 28/37